MRSVLLIGVACLLIRFDGAVAFGLLALLGLSLLDR